jgi:hypothetical protein
MNVHGKSLALMAMFAAMSITSKNQGRPFELEDIEPPKKVIPNGCKEYSFYGHTVIAINEQSAIKKCKKLASQTL